MNSPTIAWTRLLGGGYHDSATSLTTDAAGAIYVAGSTSSQVDDYASGFRSNDVFINKILIWPNDDATGTVTIKGSAKLGQVLTATNNLADADGMGTISYQWQANGVNINGATSDSLTLKQAQEGKSITVVASYTDGAGFF